MESAGAVLYHENSVTGTRNCKGLLTHEIAHQWFGDAVTEKDWFHVWLLFENAFGRK
ncbi:MAG: M1 family aminopeptidase [bacterium]